MCYRYICINIINNEHTTHKTYFFEVTCLKWARNIQWKVANHCHLNGIYIFITRSLFFKLVSLNWEEKKAFEKTWKDAFNSLESIFKIDRELSYAPIIIHAKVKVQLLYPSKSQTLLVEIRWINYMYMQHNYMKITGAS